MHYLFLTIVSFLSPLKDKPFCTCAPVKEITIEEIKHYDLIFMGEVESIDKAGSQKLIKVGINQVYKGKAENKTVIITSPATFSMCGLNIGTGSEWLFYAYGNEGAYSTNSCSRSGNLDSYIFRVKERVKNDIEFLESYKKIKA